MTINVKGDVKQYLTPFGIILIAFIFLISGSFLYSSISNPIVGIVFGLPLIIIISYILLKRFDQFSFLLIIFVCNHFRFYDNLWNLIFLGLFLLFQPGDVFKKDAQKSIFLTLFKGLFFANFIGLILNDSGSANDILLGFAVFCSYFLIFYLIINYNFNFYDFKRLFHTVIFIVFFQLIVSIFQKLGAIGIDLPFLPLVISHENIFENLSVSRVIGTFGDFELLAEYAALQMVFFTALFFYKEIKALIPYKILVTLIAALFTLVLLTGTRSSIFVISIAIAILLLTHIRILFSMKFILPIGFIILILNFMIKKGDPLGLQLVFDRISEMDFDNAGNQSSDELLNRDVTFQYAYKRLEERSWFFGNGYTFGDSYKKSLFGNVDAIVGNYHSLYLSMPIFFGWFGALFFILLIISTLLLYARNIIYSKKNSLNFYISLGLFLTWLLLFINEYKVEFIRFPNYFFLIWFWMALSLNVSKKIKNEDFYFR